MCIRDSLYFPVLYHGLRRIVKSFLLGDLECTDEMCIRDSHTGSAIDYFPEIYINPADTIGIPEFMPNYKGDVYKRQVTTATIMVEEEVPPLM